MTRSYDSGTLLWIDDDFAFDDLDRPSGEIDTWHKTFGKADSRIYRLMNLTLEVVTSKADALAVIEALEQQRSQNRFVQAVVDLRIPEQAGRKPEMMHGINVARRLRDLGIPFCFLSSSSSAQRELASRQLDRVPYYQKVGAPSPTMMPDHLVRHLLSEFRNNVSWMDLAPIMTGFDRNSSHPLLEAGKWSFFFPFFSGYRDFVERWEARSGRVRSGTIVLRSPKDHSDKFVTLCAAVVISGQQSRVAPRFNYVAASDLQSLDMLLSAGVLDDPTVHLVVRFDGKDPRSDRARLRQLLKQTARCQTYVVIPEDESADELLQELASQRDIIYDDLPRTRFHDLVAREQLIRACCRLVFQKIKLKADDGKSASLNELYLRHPEILVDPVHWSFLIDGDDVDDDISDVTEILEVFSIVADGLENAPQNVSDQLIAGYPLPVESLLRPADIVFKRHVEKQRAWTERALEQWLARSWQSPFGVTTDTTGAADQDAAAKWEEHCLAVALDLAKEFMATANLGENQLTDRSAIRGAANFLTHDVVTKMLGSSVRPEDWLRLESERWPHQQFPMPAALHRRLKREGRYLWVQTDLLDRASIILSGREALQRVEARAERHNLRMNWLSAAIPTLPEGWKQSAKLLHSVLETRSIEQAWASNADRDAVWDSLYAIVRNATPVSLIFYNLLEPSRADTIDKLHTDLTEVKGAGTLLGRIRGKRERAVPDAFRIVETQHHNWRTNLGYVQDFFQAAEVFRSFPLHQKFIGEIAGAAEKFGSEIHRLGGGVSPKPSISGSESELLVNGILQLIFEGSVGLQQGIYHNKFPPPVDASSPLHFGSLRGLTVDALMALLDATEKLRAALTPIVYFDGYHFLGLVQDLRNLEKGLSPKDLNPRVLHKVFELFLLGFEGLVAQLRACLEHTGRTDLASLIPIGTVELKQVRELSPEERLQLNRVIRVVGNQNNYSVFTVGIPGGRAVSRHAFDMPGSGLMYFEAEAAMAAE